MWPGTHSWNMSGSIGGQCPNIFKRQLAHMFCPFSFPSFILYVESRSVGWTTRCDMSREWPWAWKSHTCQNSQIFESQVPDTMLLSCQLWTSHLWASLTWERNKPLFTSTAGSLPLQLNRIWTNSSCDLAHIKKLVGASLVVNNPPANAGDSGPIPGSGRFPQEGNGNPLQYSCLEKSHGQRSLAGYS